MTPITLNLLADPRPDLAADTVLWSRLLPSVAQLEGPACYNCRSLLGALRGLRCEGAGLERQGGRVRLVPGYMDPEDYAEKRRIWLVPHAAVLTAALVELGERLQRLEANGAEEV